MAEKRYNPKWWKLPTFEVWQRKKYGYVRYKVTGSKKRANIFRMMANEKTVMMHIEREITEKEVRNFIREKMINETKN